MISNGHESSLAHLEREAARNRAELIGTIETLQDRLAPSAIKEDVRHYVQDKKEGLVRSLQARARQNPLQAVAIAGAAAYPLWHIVTRMPAPLLLIGAGLALARTRNGAPGSNGFLADARTRLGEVTDAAKQKLEQATETVQQTAEQTMASARAAADEVSSHVSELRSRAADSAEAMAARLREKRTGVADGGGRPHLDAASAASEMAASGYRSATDTAQRLREQVLKAGERAEETFADTVQRHPVMVGAIGLALGAIVAAALPISRPEEEILGAPAGELKRKAQDLAAENLEAVKDAAGEIYDETLAFATEQGLSREGLKEAAGTLGEKMKDVVSSAKEAALSRPAPVTDTSTGS